jgi:citrate lyase synthetase
MKYNLRHEFSSPQRHSPASHEPARGYGICKQVVSKLVNLSKSHKKIILYASPEKEPFYRKIDFKRMETAMAIFEDQTQSLEDGLLIDEA